jgi:hypothetical protein
LFISRYYHRVPVFECLKTDRTVPAEDSTVSQEKKKRKKGKKKKKKKKKRMCAL